MIAFQLFYDRRTVRCSVSLFRRFFLLKSMGSPGWYAFSSWLPSLKVNVPSKNALWKDKFLFFHLPSSSGLRSRWNLSKIFDRLDESLVIPGFDAVEGSGRRCILLSNFSEPTLVRAGLSRAQLSNDSEEGSSQSESSNGSGSPSLGTSFLFLFF